MQPKFTKQSLALKRIFAATFLVLVSFCFSYGQKNAGQQLAAAKKQFIEQQKKAEEARLQSSSVSSFGPAPVSKITMDGIQPNAGSPFSSAFCYNGAGPFQLNKQSLLNTNLTPIGATVGFGFPGAAAWVTTTQKMYVVDQAAPFALYIVDTLTGVRTFVANCTNVPQANLTGMTWDPSSNTMYGVSSSLAVSQIFTINITTGVCTPIGSPTSVAPGVIMVNAAPGGTLFSTDIVNDNLYKWNKATGVPTLVGPCGFDLNFGQDGHFDISDGQYFFAAYNNSVGQAQLRIIDTLTGSSTLVGAYGGQIETLAIYPVPQTPCSGTPVPGNTVSSANPVCPNITFTLSTQLPAGSGYTHQWFTSTDGINWSIIPGATNGAYATSQTIAHYFKDSVRCTSAGAFAISTPLLVTMNPVTACYCIPTYSNGCTFGDYIARVQLLTLDNSSLCSTPPFTYYSAVPAPTLIAGGTYTVSVTVGPDTFGQNVGAWIDYNQDGVFSPSEFLAAPINAGASGTANLVFTVPLTATAGQTRIRIRGGDDVAMTSGQACGASNSTYGEAEDYNVIIAPCITGSFTTQTVNTSAQCGSVITFNAVHNGSGLSYRWEYRTTPTGIWLNVPSAAPYSGVTTNTLTITDVNTGLSGYQYRLVVSGPCTATDFSTAATLTVTPLVATVDPPSATICLGSIQKLSITNVLGSPPVTTVSFSSGPISLPVPDGVAAPTLSTIAVSGIPAGAVITNVSVHLNMLHTYPADMVFNLKGPNATNILSLYKHNGNTDNGANSIPGAGFYDAIASSTAAVQFKTVPTPYHYGQAPVPGPYAADALNNVTPFGYNINDPLGWESNVTNWPSLYTTPGPNGTWTLAMCDGGAGDVGTLTLWSISISYTAPTFATGIWTSNPAAPNTMFTDPAASVAYTGTPVTSIYVKPAVNTVYSVVVTTPTPCVSAPTLVPVNVTTPISNLSIPATKSACVGDNATITATANGGPITWQWQVSVNNGVTYTDISGATSATLTLTNVTQLMNNYRYRVTGTASPCGSVASPSFTTLIVNPLPTVSLSANPSQVMPGVTTFVTASSTPAAASYSWTLNGAPITGATTSSVFADVDKMGSYKVTVTDVNGCVRTSAELVVSARDNSRLWIYPNPNNGQFQARLYTPAIYLYDVHIVTIYNAAGQILLTKTFPITSQYVRMNFDMRGYAAGVYVAKVTHHFTGKPTTAQFVIQH